MAAKNERYFGFDGIDGLRSAFTPYRETLENFPQDADVLFASYQQEDYEGSAHVLFRRDGVLYEVNGSHCSCNGLEDSWSPEVTSWAALRLRPKTMWESVEARLAYAELLAYEGSGKSLKPRQAHRTVERLGGGRAISLADEFVH